MTRRRGFTLVEVMTVIAVILILAGMLFIGARYMSASAKRDKTRAMLQTLRAMVTEREAPVGATKNKADIDAIILAAGSPATTTILTKTYLDATQLNGQLYPATPYTSGAVAGANNGAGATQFVIAMLMSIPANKTAMAGMPQESFLKPQTAGTSYNPPLLLDGYESPIIAVPDTGLSGLTSNGVAIGPKASTDGKTFFVSAGPDGDFTTDDDNVYSFNN